MAVAYNSDPPIHTSILLRASANEPSPLELNEANMAFFDFEPHNFHIGDRVFKFKTRDLMQKLLNPR